MKSALVAGGAGFLGSHLVDKLLSLGCKVVALDNLTTGDLRNLDLAVKHGDRFEFVKHDIVNPLPDLDHEKFDVIFNFACPASPKAYAADPIQTMMTCVVGTKHLLDLSTRQDAIFVQASTSEVYGDPDKAHHPQKETYWGNVNPCGPRSNYDEGKRAAESLCFDFHRMNKTRIKVARIFNTFGPRMQHDDGRVVSNFIVQAIQGEKFTVYGSGQQTRSFCYVDDLIDGFILLANSSDEFMGPVNLGNPHEIRISELVGSIIANVFPMNSANFSPENVLAAFKFDFLELPKDDPQQRKPDITLAKEQLRWEPKITLQEGLRRTIKYFRGRIDG